MAINRQDSRHRIKRSTLTGVVPTVPVSSDFTDGTWLNTDIRAGEFFYNIPDEKLWIGTNTVPLELTSSIGNTLADVLANGNATGANDIIVDSGQVIKSSNGGAAISLDMSGLAKNIFISTDGIGMEASIEMTPSTFSINNSTGGISLASTYGIGMLSDVKMTSGKSIKSLNGGGQIDLDYFSSSGEVSITTDGGAQSESYLYLTPTTSYLVAGDGGSVGVGAGVNLNAATSNRIYIRGGATGVLIEGIYNSAGSGDIITFKDNFSSSITASNNVKPGILIGSQNSSINSATTNTVVIGGTGITATESNTVYASKLNIVGDAGNYYWKHNTDLLQLNTATTSTAASISMSNDQTITIKCIVNGYCSSPNRNYGATLMASFLKYGGTIYQTGTTDIVAKDGFGDGTTATIDTDGTSVRVRLTNGGGLTTKFVVAYEYLTSN